MKCYFCNGEFKKTHGLLTLCDESIGRFHVEDVDYYKCNKCKEFLFPEKTAVKIEKKEREIRESLIRNIPINEFVSATEAANILGISRQAIHKNRRINKGFIYSTEIEGKKFYSKKSIQLFMKTGDGRFPLKTERETPKVKYIITTQLPVSEEEKFTELTGDNSEVLSSWFASVNIPTEKKYAN